MVARTPRMRACRSHGTPPTLPTVARVGSRPPSARTSYAHARSWMWETRISGWAPLPMPPASVWFMLASTSDTTHSGDEPMKDSQNFTSRIAGWSAAHRKAVVRGWLAFVLVAFALGSLAGMVQLKAVESENGQSRLADQTQAEQFPSERAGEEVLIENPSGSLAGTGYRAAVSDLVARLSRTPSVASIRSPLAPGNAGQISKDGRAALVTLPDHRRSRHRAEPCRACAWRRPPPCSAPTPDCSSASSVPRVATGGQQAGQ